MNTEQVAWYHEKFLPAHDNANNVHPRVLGPLRQQGQLHYQPFGRLLEFTNIHMNPARETIDKFIVCSRNYRVDFRQPEDDVTAALMIEALPTILKAEAQDIFASKGDKTFLYSCSRADTLLQLAYRDGISHKDDSVSTLFTPPFFKEIGLEIKLVPQAKALVSASPAWQDIRRQNDNDSGQGQQSSSQLPAPIPKPENQNYPRPVFGSKFRQSVAKAPESSVYGRLEAVIRTYPCQTHNSNFPITTNLIVKKTSTAPKHANSVEGGYLCLYNI